MNAEARNGGAASSSLFPPSVFMDPDLAGMTPSL
jgi:hypothetical protein